MKKYLFIAGVMLLFTFSSCKKGHMVDAAHTYIEQGKSGNELGFDGIILTLKTNGNADLLDGGDVSERGTYTINGDRIVVMVNNQKYVFIVVSDDKIVYQGTRVLMLQLQI